MYKKVEYENSTKYIAYIDAWNAGKNGDYETAYQGFLSLAGFLDSAEEAADFSEQARKNAYSDALSHFRRGEYDEAIESLTGLEGYEDADLYLKYASAMISAREGQLDHAIDSFQGLGEFRDSAFQAEKWSAKQKEEEYTKGCSLIKDGDYKGAADVFATLTDYQDAERYLKYAQAQISLASGDHEAAQKAFTELGVFLDSSAMASQADNAGREALLSAADAAISRGAYQEAADLLSAEPLSGNGDATKLFTYVQARMPGTSRCGQHN